MLRKIGITLIALTILSPVAAFGALEALEEVAELSVTDIRLPGSSVGQAVFRKCSGCTPTIWQVDAITTYFVGADSTPVPLGELRKAAAGKQNALIYVFYRPGTNAVTRIVLDLLQGKSDSDSDSDSGQKQLNRGIQQ
ncbi:MAG: hypothetical protein QGH93_04580 [Gammaproteobacteria bacterium]|jgi:hypothetical protein|nr:hypothetical protein [Chromatiales bacterium]MDP6674111.1 hypothetical protein [Gammaproteobacteria bacterium]